MFDPPEPQPTTAAKRNVATTKPRSIVLFRTVDIGESLVVALLNGSHAKAILPRSLTLRRNLQLVAFGDKARLEGANCWQGTMCATFDSMLLRSCAYARST